MTSYICVVLRNGIPLSVTVTEKFKNKRVTALRASVLVVLSGPDVAQDHARCWVLELGVLKLRVLSLDVTSCDVYV